MEHLYLDSHHFHFEVAPMQIPNHRRNHMRFNSPDMDYEMVSLTHLFVPEISWNLKSLRIKCKNPTDVVKI
jgi:hypothetical protein